MKQLHATASATTRASLEQCFELLSTIEEYPRWYPGGVLSAQSLEHDADGLPTKAHAILHLGQGPLIKQFPLHLSVIIERLATIELRRMPEHPRDDEQLSVFWRLSEVARTRRIDVELRAHLAVPRFLPIGGMAESLARNFVDAAVGALS
ncbi:MAG: SRPBCC family protein [Solirubrobacteraceae bacterium]